MISSQKAIELYNKLDFADRKIVSDQIAYLSEKKKTGRRFLPETLFSWMFNSKADFEMSDEQIDDFISAVRAEKHAIGN